ncbi:hypothetical protein JIX59_03640 [Brevundimonas diminuta]|nr:hypothetical protein [Brevundimonas diminuta]MBK1968425.1 hypothetical protein [Brevundimonas diminuta]
MMTGRASEQLLDLLHGMAAEGLKEELERAVKRARANPDDPGMGIPPQLLDKVLKFLAQNGINAPASSPKVDALASKLAAMDLGEEDLRLN